MKRGGEMPFEQLEVMAGPFSLAVSGFAQIDEDGIHGCMAERVRVAEIVDEDGEEIPLGGFLEKLVAELTKDKLNDNPDRLDAWFAKEFEGEDD